VANALRRRQLEIANRVYKEDLERMIVERTSKLQQALDGIVRATALTVEMRDPYTAGHQKRVADLACAIASECDLSEDQIEGIRMAGIIHDLGKISVPAEILSKPSKLTQNEFNLIKEHPEVGYDILKELEFPWPIAKMVLQHHEKFDGSGYPQGLSGEEILIEARIIAVADVVEAMASHRPYRPGMGIDKALAEIVMKKGIHYDPKAVDACIKIFEHKKFTME
jgi:putative nucleotidyltransferase with HDIG domain